MTAGRREYENFSLNAGETKVLSCAFASKVAFFCEGGAGTFNIKGSVNNVIPRTQITGLAGVACVVGAITEVPLGGIFSTIEIEAVGGSVIGQLVAYWEA